MDLYINGEKIAEETVKKYGLKAGMASPFSSGVVTTAPQTKGIIKVEALKEAAIKETKQE